LPFLSTRPGSSWQQDGTSRVEVGEFKWSVNGWTAKATLGTLKASPGKDGIELTVDLEKQLPKEVRDAIWK